MQFFAQLRRGRMTAYPHSGVMRGDCSYDSGRYNHKVHTTDAQSSAEVAHIAPSAIEHLLELILSKNAVGRC